MINAHIVIGRKGETLFGIYCGPDSVQAEEEFLSAGKDFEEVHLFHHPAYSRARMPAQEAQDAEERANAAERAEADRIQAMRNQAASARVQAKKLEAEAKKLHAEAEKAEASLSDSKEK